MQSVPEHKSDWLKSRLTRALFTLAVLTTYGLITAMDYADPDLWGHVLYGQEILRDGVLPETTTWSFTAEGYRWINHENVAELLMAFAVNQFGPLGLTVGKYLIGFMLIGLIWWRASANSVSPFVSAFICLTIAMSVQFHWHFRPQIFGYLFFGITCSLLFWCFQSAADDDHKYVSRGHRLKHLFWLAPLAILWTNTHGSFAAGVAIASAFLGLKFIEFSISAFAKPDLPDVEKANARWSLLALFVAVQLICLSTLANPYGIELHKWLLGALREARPEIGDWESPPLFSFSREVIGLWVMLITTTIAFATSARKDWPRLILFLLTAFQAVSHIRHLPLLAILWGSLFAVDIDRYWKKFRSELKTQASKINQNSESPRVKQTYRPIFLRLVLATWVICVSSLTWFKLSTLRVPRDLYPVDALKFMAEHELEGRTVVIFNWAQYAIGFFANEDLDSTVAFDGRFRTCYPQEVIDIYFDFIFGESYDGPRNRSARSAAIDGSLALTYKNPELFLISDLPPYNEARIW